MSELTAAHIDDSIARALAEESRLDPAVLEILGFATPTMRRMFSNLCNIEGLKYLECGVYCGSSFVSAYHGNPIHAIGIDNFSQTWAPGRDIKGEFTANNVKFLNGVTKSVRFFCDDCFNPALLPQIGNGVDIFYWDGDHSREVTARSLPHFFENLSDKFLFILDDTEWPDVAAGWKDAKLALSSRMHIEKEWNCVGEQNANDPVWHNGVILALCEKS